MVKQNPNKLAYTGKNSKVTNRDFYGTPRKWIELSRRVMGGIELDPASCEEANTLNVKANRYYDEGMDALKLSWASSAIFLNPPYSGRAKQAFAARFHEEWNKGYIKQAIILVNNATETHAFEAFSACASARAEPRARIQFISVEGRCTANSNTRGQVIFYCGRRAKKFAKVFASAGCRVLQEIK